MKRFVSFLLVFAIFLCVLPEAYCANRKDVDHDEILKKVLTGGGMSNSTDAIKAMDMLCAASFLCADQCNGNGTGDLETLRESGVKHLPSIEEIDFQVFGGNHRSKTHAGWNYPYERNEEDDDDWEEKWQIRKNILLSTTNKVFDFGAMASISGLFGVYDTAPKCVAFAELVYYIHILGDYYGDGEKAGSSESTMKDLMPFALSSPDDNNPDILYELEENIFPVLFGDWINSTQYIELINQIDTLRIKVLRVDPSGIHYGDSSYYTAYQDFARELLDEILSDKSTSTLESNAVAYLLSQESFFKEVFWN